MRGTKIMRFESYDNVYRKDVDFTLRYAGMECCHPSHRYEGQRPEYLLHVVFSGKGVVDWSSMERRQLDSGSVFLIQPNQDFCYKADEKDPWCYGWVGFSGNKAKEYIESIGFSNGVKFWEAHQLWNVKAKLQELIEYLNQYSSEAFLGVEGLFLLFIQALQNTHSNVSDTDHLEDLYIQSALDYIKRNYHTKISVESIADYVGLERSYLCSLYKKERGHTLRDELIRFRMEKAQTLLTGTQYKVSEIAHLVGYDDYSSFCRRFKSYYNVSPSDMRSR
jgi:AraC family transcriptional regulator of arabinose operon